MTTIDRVRNVINAAVGENRLAQVRASDLLLQSGIISSLEIVIVGLELEKEFGVPIPDNQLTVANFSTLETLAALMDRLGGNGANGESGSDPVPDAGDTGFYKSLQDSLASCLRHPVILSVMVLAWLFVLDRAVLPYVVERGPLSGMYTSFIESGRRLYQSSGGWAANDLNFAVKRHEFTQSMNKTRPAVLFFGDSGTIGSWLPAEQALPAQTEIRLRQSFPKARVFNLAFFMRSFIKDVMLLESLLESNGDPLPVDAVIFTLSDAYFDSKFQRHLIDALPYFSLNRRLLTRFRDRVNARDPVPYANLYQHLAKANRKFRGRFEEYFLERTAIYRYQTFFTFLTLYGKDPSGFWGKEHAIGNKPLFPQRLPAPPANFKLHDTGLTKESLDHDLVALTNDTLDFLRSKNIKVYFFLRPYAPLEWRNHPFPAGPMNMDTLIREQGWDKKATIIDLRWSLYGNQFSDSLSHYTPEGSRILGEAIGDAIKITLKVPATGAAGVSR